MITKEQAVNAAKEYLSTRGRNYTRLLEDKASFTKAHIVPEEEKKKIIEVDAFVVAYEIEGYQDPIAFFLVISAETGKVFFTRGPHGIVEDRE